MTRFTIRDVLWLIVVVGCVLALLRLEAYNHQLIQGCERDKAQLERCLVKAARDWAKEKGESVTIDIGAHLIEATPSGSVKLLGK